jgi:hypothetical protein
MSDNWDAISKPVRGRAASDWDSISRPASREPVMVSPVNVDPAEGMGPVDKMLVGAGSAMTRVGHALSSPFASDETKAARKADRDLYEKHHPGGWATAGEIGADVLMSAVPVTKTAQAGSVLARTLGARRAAPLVGDVAANAAYSAATAPEDRDAAAAMGAAGAAGGRLLARTLAARAPKVAEGVKELADRGVPMTPGQLYGLGLVRSVEDKLTSTPIVGDLIARARKRSLESYNRSELDDAIAPLGRTVRTSGVGKSAVDEAEHLVEKAYDEALQRVFMTPQAAMSAARGAIAQADETIPMLDPRQLGQLDLFVRKRIEPVMDQLGDRPLKGEYVKVIDTEIGHQARKFSKSLNPSDHSLGDAFYVLQSQWRDAMQASGRTSSGRDALELLQGANAAYRKLLPIKLASERTASGVFTPQGMNQAGKSSKVGNSKLTQAARSVLPSTVPDSGTASRTLWGLGALGGVSMLDAGATLGTAAATAAATSGPATKAMTKAATALSGKGLYDTLTPELQRLLDKLDPELARYVLANLGARSATNAGQ